MITLRTLRDDWEERQSGLGIHIDHLEHMLRLGSVEAEARESANLWLETLRRWKREIEVLLRQD